MNDKNYNLLLLEDDLDQRGLLELLFKAEGYSVVCVDNGQEGLEAIRERQFDVIVCDVMMPVMDGLAFVEKLRLDDQHSRTPVLMLTAGSDSDLEFKLLENGANDFCEKNIQRKVLVKRVEKLLQA